MMLSHRLEAGQAQRLGREGIAQMQKGTQGLEVFGGKMWENPQGISEIHGKYMAF